MNVYDDNAPKLVAQERFPIPIAPANATYVAKKSPVAFNAYQNRYFNLTDWSTMTAPITAPQPGANIGVRLGGGLVGADCDSEEAAQKFSQAFPNSPVVKKGQKGFTAFYRADFDVKTSMMQTVTKS
jgi:hypothetical protein